MTDKEDKAKGTSGSMKGISIVGKIVGLVVSVWLISASYFAFAFFILGMLPAIVSVLVDRGSGRFASKTVTACNFVGILPFLFEIGNSYEKTVAAKQIMADSVSWLFIYSAAIIGWIMIWVFPQVSLIIFNIRADMKLSKLRKEQDELLVEWGEELKSKKSK